MADEISVSLSLTSRLSGENPISLAPESMSIDKAAKGRFSTTITVGTSEETLSAFGELATEGLCVIRNLDATNFVSIGSSTGSYLIKSMPGESYFFRLVPGLTLYLKADTANCLLDITVLEN